MPNQGLFTLPLLIFVKNFTNHQETVGFLMNFLLSKMDDGEHDGHDGACDDNDGRSDGRAVHTCRSKRRVRRVRRHVRGAIRRKRRFARHVRRLQRGSRRLGRLIKLMCRSVRRTRLGILQY